MLLTLYTVLTVHMKNMHGLGAGHDCMQLENIWIKEGKGTSARS